MVTAPERREVQRSRASGASMIEFALAAPLLVVLLIAMLDFGLFMFTMVNIQHAASEGARYGVTGQAMTEARPRGLTRKESIEKVIQDKAIRPRDRANLTITLRQINPDVLDSQGRPVEVPFSDGGSLMTLDVKVEMEYPLFISSFLSRPVKIPIVGHAVMRNEAFPR